MSPADLTRTLAHHRPADARETESLERIRTLLRESEAPFSRATPQGHVTASAVVLSQEGRALLLSHARLGLWVQPGGHVEAQDADVAAAAMREATEESGLADLALVERDGQPLVLDVDVHPIPANEARGEPAHFHHDVCFVAVTKRAQDARFDPEESRAMRWVSADEWSALPLDPATQRRLSKAFALAARTAA